MAIETRNLTKTVTRPHKQTLLHPLDLQVGAGECVALLGANGSGKSTLLKMLTGVLLPSQGEVRVLGRNPQRERHLLTREIGVVFGHRSSLLWDLPLKDSLRVCRHMYSIPKVAYQQRLDELLGLLQLEELLERPVKNFSLGQKMKAELLSVLLHRPKVLFLDEPTLGLDVVVRSHIKTHLKELNFRDGTTVVLTSHDMGDIDGLCHRAVILQQGQCIYNDVLGKLQASVVHQRRVVVKTTLDADLQAIRRVVSPVGACEVPQPQVLHFEVSTQDPHTPRVLQQLLGREDVLDMQITEVDLEQVIRELFQQHPPERGVR